MFLEATKRRNPKMIETAIQLHQQGTILPDTYILDLDMIEANAKQMLAVAKEHQVELFYMTKQIGRNPLVAKKLTELGMTHAVVVDFKEALVMMENGLALGNVGHLVQVPQHLLEKVISYGTKYITVYSMEMLESIQKVAKKIGKKQAVLLRIVSDEDQLYPGQYGGFLLEEVVQDFPGMKACDFVDIKGITSFPCFLYQAETHELEATHNVKTIQKAKKLFGEAGFQLDELNVPSATCSRTIPFIQSFGGTQGEPGHALTGTTPMHALTDLPEKPAMVYVSEISHTFKGQSYLYGGGYYRRGHLENVLIDNQGTRTLGKVAPFADENIDYYLEVDGEQPVGATAIMAFRTQIFVTRSEVAVVSGIQSGKPKVEGIYDSQGKFLRR